PLPRRPGPHPGPAPLPGARADHGPAGVGLVSQHGDLGWGGGPFTVVVVLPTLAAQAPAPLPFPDSDHGASGRAGRPLQHRNGVQFPPGFLAASAWGASP